MNRYKSHYSLNYYCYIVDLIKRLNLHLTNLIRPFFKKWSTIISILFQTGNFINIHDNEESSRNWFTVSKRCRADRWCLTMHISKIRWSCTWSKEYKTFWVYNKCFEWVHCLALYQASLLNIWCERLSLALWNYFKRYCFCLVLSFLSY